MSFRKTLWYFLYYWRPFWIFCVIVDQVLEHEIPQNKNVILNESQVCVSDVHLDVMYNHDNWDFICYFGGHFVLQFWKEKTENRAWHGADLESAYPNCVKTTTWQILLRNALQTLRMFFFWKMGPDYIVKLFSEPSDMSMRNLLYSYWRTCCPTLWGPIAIVIALALCRRTEWLWWIRTIKLRNRGKGYIITQYKIISKSRNSQRAHMLPFHSGFCTVRLSFLLMPLHKLTFLEVRIFLP